MEENKHNIQLYDNVIIEACALAIVLGRNVHDKTFLVRLIGNQGMSKLIRVKMVNCLPANYASWVLYTKGTKEQYDTIMTRGCLE
jgi:hypothetical protein